MESKTHFSIQYNKYFTLIKIFKWCIWKIQKENLYSK